VLDEGLTGCAFGHGIHPFQWAFQWAPIGVASWHCRLVHLASRGMRPAHRL
jgi:hypothetical protein